MLLVGRASGGDRWRVFRENPRAQVENAVVGNSTTFDKLHRRLTAERGAERSGRHCKLRTA
jgi:hypothetical protein